MHAVFIPYGNREWVERLLRQIEGTWFNQIWTKGKEKKNFLIKANIRVLPLGAYEIIFPREYKNRVLSTLKFDIDRYRLGFKSALLRKLFKCKKAKFKQVQPLLWFDEITEQSVNIIPIGIREDIDVEDTKNKGWIHESL